MKLNYLILNAMRNVNLVKLNSKIKTASLNHDSLSELSLVASFQSNQSASRNLCNLFWSKVDFEAIANQLDSPINALEIGCGTGRYSEYVLRNNELNSYTGLDIQESSQWKNHSLRNVEFVQEDYRNVLKYLPNKNFVFTQSALEHFENDVEFIQTIETYFRATKKPAIAMHLIPPASTLYTHLWHGFRQYPLRAINKLFGASSAITFILALGGDKTNSVHRRFVTYPTVFWKRDLRNQKPQEYLEALMEAVNQDCKKPQIKSATFLAVIQIFNLDCGFEIDDFMQSSFRILPNRDGN